MNFRKSKKNKQEHEPDAELGDKSSDSVSTFRSRGRLVLAGLLVVVLVVAGIMLIDYLGRGPIREAQSKLREKDYGYALAVLEDYLVSHPNDIFARSLKAQAHAGLNQFEECRKIYEDLQGPSSIEDMFAFAKSMTVLENYNEAYHNWIGVMAKISDGELDNRSREDKYDYQAEALYFMAACQAELGQLNRAAETAKALKSVPNHEAIGRYLAGLVEIKRGNPEVAIEEWDRVLELDPQAEQINVPRNVFLYEIGIVKVENGKNEEGIKHLQEGLSLIRFDELQSRADDLDKASSAMTAIGTAYDSLGDTDNAELYWKKQVEFQLRFSLPADRKAREGLANLALIEKQPKVAINWLVPLRNQGDLKSSTTYLMQRALSMLDKDKEAREFGELTRELREKETRIQTIRDALRENPDNYMNIVVRAHGFAEKGNWRQAEQLMKTVEKHSNDEFSKKVNKAILDRGKLPKLTEIPLELF